MNNIRHTTMMNIWSFIAIFISTATTKSVTGHTLNSLDDLSPLFADKWKLDQ